MSAGLITRDAFRTTDPDEGHAYIRDVLYADHKVRSSGSAADFVFDCERVTFGGTALMRLQHTMAAAIEVPNGVGRFTVCGARRPGLGFDSGDVSIRVRPQVTAAIPARVPYSCGWQLLDADIVQFDDAQLEAAAATALPPDEPLRFAFDVNSTAVAAEHWALTCRFVERIALANAHRPDHHLLVEELNRLLAGAALMCFPNNTQRDVAPSPPRGGPPSLRRAVAYIESNADQQMSLADIADASRVSARSLNETFRRHLDVSPIGYLRRVRLDRAHQDLMDAVPGDGQTVVEIAARWGFHHLPRFSASYRQAYLRSPRDTLRRGS